MFVQNVPRSFALAARGQPIVRWDVSEKTGQPMPPAAQNKVRMSLLLHGPAVFACLVLEAQHRAVLWIDQQQPRAFSVQ